jgi:predicted nucleic acid-binding protein
LEKVSGTDERFARAEPRVPEKADTMSWLLDADVLSQAAKTNGDARVVAWLDQNQDDCYTCTIVIAQIAYWIRSKTGRPRLALQRWLEESIDAMEGRILSINIAAAHVWADQQVLLEKAGKKMPVEDSYIAAIARRHNLTIVTGNEKDFDRPGLRVFNPFTGAISN